MITDDNGFLVILNDDEYTNKLNLSKVNFDNKKNNDIVVDILKKLNHGWLISAKESRLEEKIKSWLNNYGVTKIEEISFVTKKYSVIQQQEFNTEYKLIDNKTFNEYKDKLETGEIISELNVKNYMGYKIKIKDNIIACFAKFRYDEKEYAIFGIINK